MRISDWSSDVCSSDLSYWWMMLLIAGGGFYALFEAKRRSANFRRLLDRILLKMPIIGDILYKSAVARFARTLSTMFAAGVPLVEAMDSVGKAAGNRSEEHRLNSSH